MDQRVFYLFGSQALSFSSADLERIRTAVNDHPGLHWVSSTAAELPSIVREISRSTGLSLPAKVLDDAETLPRWLAAGMPQTDCRLPIPNVVLTPLVVLGHLVEYTILAGSTFASSEPEVLGTLGLCTGLLSAFSVAASHDPNNLARYGAVALRLAVLIGATVDAQDIQDPAGPAKSFGVAWNPPTTHDQLVQIVADLPNTYVAVEYDNCRATITTSARDAHVLRSKLHTTGMTTTEVGLSGRFHWVGHHSAVNEILAFCRDKEVYHFPEPADLALPTKGNQTGGISAADRLHELAIRSLLLSKPQWSETVAEAVDPLFNRQDGLVITIGSERPLPPSISSKLRGRVRHATDIAARNDPSSFASVSPLPYKDDDIAIVGMSCKVAGADGLEEFWELLCQGKSQHREAPEDRFDFDSPFRKKDPTRKWYGNFIDDYDSFDTKFFKKSPREAGATDPQQRQLLQIAHQAVQQSGYLGSQNPDPNVGCYIGVCSVDYENNIACHEANAYSAIGNLRGFIAGKISHHFGWTGPGLTIDTACSSSAVAIHQACRAILSGECNSALAGGTHVMTSPLWFQNLAGASFLSPTGSCKPFDAAADGYCRGEGVAAVFLKRASAAVQDGDTIFATIAATAVQQNENRTPIFVPNSPSLSHLFRRVMDRAQLCAEQISVVEAHGTGTSVGDPVEYNSVRDVLGGSNRASDLALSSVKGLVGHLECTSGVISLIKIVLMMLKGAIPPQANFHTLNPTIKASASDRILIPTSVLPWSANFKAALINNYGASGSNASVVVKQAARVPKGQRLTVARKYPFRFAALDRKSLCNYTTTFHGYLRGLKISNMENALESISFNLLRESNPALPERLVFTSDSTHDLAAQLQRYEEGPTDFQSKAETISRPVILCFGGQSSTFVGLSRELYECSALLRRHLTDCNSACMSLDMPSIFPSIFQRSKVDSLPLLHAMLFSLQYSCARCWIDSGITPSALIGHSFGELTALAVSETLSLQDCLKAIVGRARVIQRLWGPDAGAMLAVEGDLDQVERLLIESNRKSESISHATIACFNGTRSFTIAGPRHAMDLVLGTLKDNADCSTLRSKPLNVTHAYHSVLASPLMDEVERSAQGIRFRGCKIPLERSTKSASDAPLTPRSFAEHMRDPVYFSSAVQRLVQRFPSAVWLEAGSSSSVTQLAKRCIPDAKPHHFQGLDITNRDDALDNLSETTASLWRAGVSTNFWLHHRSQSQEYKPLLLPPYQFEKARHWMEQKKAPRPPPAPPADVPKPCPETLLQFVGYSDDKRASARFKVNTGMAAYENLLSGHVIANTAPICPATVQLDLAIEALRTLHREVLSVDFLPEIQNVQNHTALCRDHSRTVWIELDYVGDKSSWSFRITSSGPASSGAVTHTTGRLVLRSADEMSRSQDFARYGRLRTHQHCLDVLDDPNASEIIQGRNIYRAFSDVVDYSPPYQGLQKLVGRGSESAGKASQTYSSETWLDPLLSDTFCQVAGIYANCMTDLNPDDMYIACDIELWMRSPSLSGDAPRPDVYHVLATHSRPAKDTITSDVFVFDGHKGTLVEIILGIQYRAVKKLSMQRTLARLSPSSPTASPATTPQSSEPTGEAHSVRIQSVKPALVRRDAQHVAPRSMSSPHASSPVPDQIKDAISTLLGLERGQIRESDGLADLGVDSLMAMELVSEIERRIGCSLDMGQVAEVTNVSGLIHCVSSALPRPGHIIPHASEGLSEEDSAESTSDSSSSDLTTLTAATTPEEHSFDAKTHLAQFLGLGDDSIDEGAILRDLGVDSLLGIELRADLASTFGFHVPADQSVEDMSIKELQAVFCPKAAASRPEELVPKSCLVTASPHQVSPQTLRSATETQSPVTVPLVLPFSVIEQAFAATKLQTDDLFVEFKCQDYYATSLPRKTDLCYALIVEALEKLGCRLRTTNEGEELLMIHCNPGSKHLRDHLYQMLDTGAGLLSMKGERAYRTGKPLTLPSSRQLMDQTLLSAPGEVAALQLIHHAGSQLADIMACKTDGIKLIFGSEKGRKLVSALYGEWPINRLMYRQIENFLSALSEKLSSTDGTLRILEMGAGTGGTTQWLIPLLAKLAINVEYTFTDLSPSFVAAARKRFGQYDFIKYMTHNIEDPPPQGFQHSQHIVIASNAVHATHDLTRSASNIRQFLRPDGALMMVEMTTPLLWVDIIFGLFEGWWFFEDGRSHAVTHEEDWRRHLQAAGFVSVDWTDGKRPENKLERLIIATASGPTTSPAGLTQALSWSGPPRKFTEQYESRMANVEHYVQQMVARFVPPSIAKTEMKSLPAGACVVVTGASGSLGSHLVSDLVEREDVRSVICLNRPHKGDAHPHQLKALLSRGISVSPQGLDKLRVLEGDMTQPMLGLQEQTYHSLLNTVTCVVHNAWAMSAKRPLSGFESQFRIMENVLTLASDIASRRSSDQRTRLLFVSSIAVVGQYPSWKGTPHVPEERVSIEAVLPNGYGEAKWACELALDRTLHKYPEHFSTSTVRIGQIAGSRRSGYWNPMEHSAFLWKSSQTLNAIPAFEGLLSWTPVDDVAATLADLIAVNDPHPIYNIDNPVRQAWGEMIPVLARALAIPKGNIVPFAEWISRVREHAETGREGNPAFSLLEFLEGNFERMSCGGLLLDTRKAQEHSPTLRAVGPVGEEVVWRFVRAWKEMRFLSNDGSDETVERS